MRRYHRYLTEHPVLRAVEPGLIFGAAGWLILDDSAIGAVVDGILFGMSLGVLLYAYDRWRAPRKREGATD